MAVDISELYLCNFDILNFESKHDTLNKLWTHRWAPENNELMQKILKTAFSEEHLTDVIKESLSNDQDIDDILHLAIGSILTFAEHNWCNLKKVDFVLHSEWPKSANASLEIQADSIEIIPNILNVELLYFTMKIFKVLCKLEDNLVYLWWYFRCKVLQQRILEDYSNSVYTELEHIIAKLSNENLKLGEKPRLQMLLYIEIAQAYLMYRRLPETKMYLEKAKAVTNIKIELLGILGKRTKYQHKDLPQLALSINLDDKTERPSAESTHGTTELPHLISLNDDVRLDNVKYVEEIQNAELPALEQTYCLLEVQYLHQAQPDDGLKQEEQLSYVDALLADKYSAWSTRTAAILLRCKMEGNHKRTVERSMTQCEEVVKQKFDGDTVHRLSYLWASGLKLCWMWELQLADLCLSLGLVKGALDYYLKLQQWEEVIVCYTMLELRHQAAEIIQQQIDVKPTPKLYCLLGDATDNVDCYKQAWDFSGHKSSRAQRHWGNYLFGRKQYEECIEHYEKSLEINSLQEHVWLRLGFAALTCEKWDLSATAYRRYTYLHPNSFEAWNNLANVYVKQGDKNRAYRALMEALKDNHDSWKLWENVMLVSMDTGHFDDVILASHRLMDIKGKLNDYEVLRLLVRAVNEDHVDANGNPAKNLKKKLRELFARITSVHRNLPEAWELYSELSEGMQKSQALIAAYRGYTEKGEWSKNPVSCGKVIKLVNTLLENSLSEDCKDITNILSSARLIGQSVLRAAEKEDWPDCEGLLQELRKNHEDITACLTNLLK